MMEGGPTVSSRQIWIVRGICIAALVVIAVWTLLDPAVPPIHY